MEFKTSYRHLENSAQQGVGAGGELELDPLAGGEEVLLMQSVIAIHSKPFDYSKARSQHSEHTWV